MAYDKKSGGGCTPITAKIKRVTRGGMTVTQPALNMGAPVSMKQGMPGESSAKMMDKPAPTKQGGNNKFRAKQQAKMAAEKAAKDKALYDKKLERYKAMDAKIKSDDFKGSQANRARTGGVRSMGYFEKELYDYDMKRKPDQVAKSGAKNAKEYAQFKAYGGSKTKKTAPKGKTKISERKKQKAVSVIEKPKVSITNPKPKATKVEVKPKVKAKITPKAKKAAKVTARKTASIDKKLAKAELAAALGNTKKAARKTKRANKKIARIEKRANKKATGFIASEATRLAGAMGSNKLKRKKKGQASKAVDPMGV